MSSQTPAPGYDLLKASEVQLDESRRSLDGQRNDLVGLRERAGGLLSAAAVAASVAGALGTGHRFPWILVVAGVAFVVVTGSSLYVLWPRTFTFEVDSASFEELHVRLEDVAQLNRSVATSLTDFRASNASSLEHMLEAYVVGLVAVGIEVVALVAHSVAG